MRKALLTVAAFAALICSPAFAWGDLGHEVTALIAYRHLTPAARTALDAMLASDTDTLTAGDFASRATWADKYRNNLHAYWDVNVVVALGQSAAAIADRLDAHLNAADLDAWTASSPRSWAMDSFDVGRRDVYALAALPTCQSGGQPVSLPPEYRRQAEKDAALQLQKAGARLAAVLNAALRAPSRRSND